MENNRSSRKARTGAGLLALALTGGGGLLAFGPGTGSASSHREAPLTAASPQIDNTDVYAFVSPDKADTLTLIANWHPFQDPAGGPNFYPWGSDGYRYNIKVDNNGDAEPDLTYRFTFQDIDKRTGETFLYNNGPVESFDDPTLLFKQTYTIEQIGADGSAVTIKEGGKVAPSHVGEASMPNYQALRDEAVTDIGEGKTAFVGQADDPFFLDLRIFDLLYGGDLSEVGNASLSGFNVNTIALQIPIAEVTKGGDDSGVVGVWSTTDQQTMQLGGGKATPTGEFVQVSRLGNPLVNEAVLPIGLKDAYNSLPPAKDSTIPEVVARVTDPEVPKLIEKIYGIPAPPAPREDLVSVFLTGVKGLNQPTKVEAAEMLRLNTKTPVTAEPSRLGVLGEDNQGFPNGRRLTDDVVDIELQALEGAIITGEIVEPLAAGDAVDSNDVEFSDTFPYVALPHSGSGPASAGFGPASSEDSGSGSAEPSASPSSPGSSNDSGDESRTNASNDDSADDGIGAGALAITGVLALLVGLGIGAAVSSRKKNES